MALTHCIDCGREVSPKARLCVHCGRPWPSRKCGGLWKGAKILAAVGVIAGGWLFVSNWRSNSEFRDDVLKLQTKILNEVQDLRTKVAAKVSPTQAPEVLETKSEKK